MQTFSSIAALRKYLAVINDCEASDFERIELSTVMRQTDYMIVHKANKKLALGFATITYDGIHIGRGKVFICNARTA